MGIEPETWPERYRNADDEGWWDVMDARWGIPEDRDRAICLCACRSKQEAIDAAIEGGWGPAWIVHTTVDDEVLAELYFDGEEVIEG